MYFNHKKTEDDWDLLYDDQEGWSDAESDNKQTKSPEGALNTNGAGEGMNPKELAFIRPELQPRLPIRHTCARE